MKYALKHTSAVKVLIGKLKVCFERLVKSVYIAAENVYFFSKIKSAPLSWLEVLLIEIATVEGKSI